MPSIAPQSGPHRCASAGLYVARRAQLILAQFKRRTVQSASAEKRPLDQAHQKFQRETLITVSRNPNGRLRTPLGEIGSGAQPCATPTLRRAPDPISRADGRPATSPDAKRMCGCPPPHAAAQSRRVRLARCTAASAVARVFVMSRDAHRAAQPSAANHGRRAAGTEACGAVRGWFHERPNQSTKHCRTEA